MKKILMKFMSVFTAIFIVLSVVVVPVSAAEHTGSDLYTDEQINLSVSVSDAFDNYFANKSDWTAEQLEIIDSYDYFIKVICPGSTSESVFSYFCLYILLSDIPEYDAEKNMFNLDGISAYCFRFQFTIKDSSFLFLNSFSFANNGVVDFYDDDDKYYVRSLSNFCNLSLSTCVYPVLYFDNFSEQKKDVDIKVNVDGVSDTLLTSIDITENPDFYIDITNNTENAIQFVAWISDTPASSGAYNSYSRLNWTYSTQQWAYVYHGTWAVVDAARNVLDIYGNLIDTADLIGICWWKDSLVGAVDDSLPKAYYSRDNISSPYHFVSPGGNFNEKFSFNTATLSKDKEYYFNIVYRQVISYEIIDGAIALLNSAFHDNFEDLNYYELGYCTAFSLTTDTIPESSTDTNITFPSDFSTTITNTKTPAATMGNDGNISLAGGNNDLNNSINFNPSISNSNYNGGVTINNNVGGSGGNYTGDYGDFDGDVTKLEELLNKCTNFFGFLKSGVNYFLPPEYFPYITGFFMFIVFLRVLSR